MRTIVLLCLMLMAGLPAMAQWNLKLTNFTKADYGSGAQNWGARQHANNWLYFANNYGVLEFDGIHWTTYPVSNYSNVRAIEIDKNGRIYGGGYNEFGFYTPDDKAHLRYHSLSTSLPPHQNAFGNVWQIMAIDEAVYFQTDYAIYKHLANEPLSMASSTQKIDFATAINGTIYMANAGGIFILSGTNFFALPNTEGFTHKRICGLVPTPDGSLLVATKNDGLYLYHHNRLERWSTPADTHIKGNTFFCMAAHDNTLALGTIQNGLVVMNRDGSSPRFINHQAGLQNNTVLGLTFDKNGDLWLSLDNGITHVSLTSPLTSLYGQTNSRGAGYTALVKDNRLYIGTNQGVFVAPWPVPVTETPRQFPAIDNLTGQVWTLDDIDGTLFCGLDQGAFIIEGTTARRISGDAGFWMFRKYLPNPKWILAGNYNGFYVITQKDDQWVVKKIEGFDESARLFEQDNDGSVWMSHGLKGVYRFRFDDRLDKVVSTEFYGIDQGFPENTNISVFKIQNQIVFTTSKGIYRLNPTTRRMEPHTSLNRQLDGNHFYAKLHDPGDGSNELWYLRDNHLVIKDVRTGNAQRTAIEEGMLYGFESLRILDRETAIVGHENGFSLFNRSHIMPHRQGFANTIRKVYTTTPHDSLVWALSNLDPDGRDLTIPYLHNSLRIECITAPFGSDPQVATSYRLLPADDTWLPLPASGVKEFTGLREGDYRFELQSVHRGNKTTNTTSIAFTVLPPWYRTTAMYLAYLTIVATLLYLIYYLIGQRIRQNRMEVETVKNHQMEEQKAHFMQDAHEREKEIMQLQADKLQYELKGKSQELANTVMNLVRKNEILNDITVELQKSCTAETLESARSRLRKLQIKIKENIEHDDDWKRFEENFDMVHDNFMKQLSERFPQLTKSEKKLCAYLRLNLVSKDIAPLLNISVRGVEISRYRLRKKLDLPRDTNLTDYLQNM